MKCCHRSGIEVLYCMERVKLLMVSSAFLMLNNILLDARKVTIATSNDRLDNSLNSIALLQYSSLQLADIVAKGTLLTDWCFRV